MKPKEIIEQGFNRIYSIYTKCNTKKGESFISGNYRQVWGLLKSETEFEIHMFSVIRDGSLDNRCINLSKDKRKIIKIDPETDLEIIR